VSQNDARYPGKVTIHYPLHPFHGQKDLAVIRRFGSGRVEQVEVDTGQRRQLVPAWMTNQGRCEQMSIGSEPHCSLSALWELMALLRTSGL
jgi:hypothetical protein